MSVEWIQLGPCRLAQADCMDALQELSAVDAVVTDPPYSVSLPGSSGSFTRINNKGTRSLSFFEGDTDWPKMTRSVVERIAASLLLNPLSIYCWCGHRQFGPLTELLESSGYSTRFLVWRKTCPAPAPPRSGWQSGAELCLYGYKPGRHFADGMFNNVIDSDSFRFGQPGKVDHPTQKPIKTIQPLIEVSTIADSLVLDPYMGSGTTGIACIRTGRQFIGIEKDPAHFATAVERIRRELAQPMLLPVTPLKHEEGALL